MKRCIPEQKGISSKNISEYIDRLEQYGLSTHDLIIARGDSILFERYWEPFKDTDTHRMYSVSKSFVAIAVGFCIDDGLLSIDDPMEKHFPKELMDVSDENIRRQTVKNMLMMSTSRRGFSWFSDRPTDRVMHYFHYNDGITHPAGTIFDYDSEGSFVLGALVERLTGKTLMQYLREKLFDKIGVSDSIDCLECPGGHSWGDSAILARPMDLMRVARFVMNGGSWNGEQLISRKFITDAVSRQIDNSEISEYNYNAFGYGYLFWRTYDNSYFFNGMGCQFAVCVPDKDLIMVYNGDNQGVAHAGDTVIRSFFELIARKAADTPLPPDKDGNDALNLPLKLYAQKGECASEFTHLVEDRTYRLNENPMGIEYFRLSFDGDEGILSYKNATGEKKLPFGMCKNLFGLFPEEGYSDRVGSVRASGNFYKCASSAGWVDPHNLHINIQIIDKYLGRLHIRISFADGGDSVALQLVKTAEDFLDEYSGWAEGRAE